MRVELLAALLVTALPIVACDLRAHAQNYTFADIVFPGSTETTVNGINNSGVVVGTYGEDLDIRRPINLGSKGFAYDGNNWTTLQPFGSPIATANAINSSGIVVGDFLAAGNNLHGYLYDGAAFHDILPPGATEAILSSITDDGVLVGTYSKFKGLSTGNFANAEIHGYRAIPDGSGGYVYETFDFPTATHTFINGRNDAGVEVGTAATEGIFGDEVFGFVSPFQKFTHPAGNSSLVSSTSLAGINNHGVVLGNVTLIDFDAETETIVGRSQAFRFDAAELGTGLPSLRDLELPGPDCRFTVNNDGSLNEPCRKSASDQNDQGDFVGFYDNNDGILIGFVATLVSETGADFDSDDDVDGSDFLAWQRGESPNSLSAEDLALWESQYGALGTRPLSSAVPEPLASLLLLPAISCAGFRRPRD